MWQALHKILTVAPVAQRIYAISASTRDGYDISWAEEILRAVGALLNIGPNIDNWPLEH